MLKPNPSDRTLRDEVLKSVLEFIRESKVIRMNDPAFAGTVGEYKYFFEGEDDLLHVAIERKKEGPLSVEEAQAVLSFLAPLLPAGVVWVKPGTNSHHFYFAHDELL